MSTPRVAILLAAYNGSKWIEEQVRTILDQDAVSLVLFISIDKSSDNTETLLKALAQKDQRIFILKSGHFGGAARNFYRLFQDVQFDKFDYVCLADQDDIWLRDKIQSAIAAMLEHDVDGYSSNVTAFWPSGQQKLISKDFPQTMADFMFEAAGPGCSYVLTSRLACSFQNFLAQTKGRAYEIALHDWLIYAFARTHGFRWFLDSIPHLLYRQHNKNEVGANIGIKAFISRAEKVSSGWAFKQAALIASLTKARHEIPFIRDWLSGQRLGLLQLAINAKHCRRNPRDRIYFFLACVIAFLRDINCQNSKDGFGD